MKATDFTRDDCLLGKHRKSYNRLILVYRCEDCGNRIVQLWDESYPENWHVACVVMSCRSHNFIHEQQAQKQKGQAARALGTLPQEIVKAYLENRKRRPTCQS